MGIKDIEIKNVPSALEKKAETPIIFLLFLLAGTFGLLLSLYALDNVSYSIWIVFSAAAGFCVLLWRLYSCGQEVFCRISLLLSIAFVFYIIILRDILEIQFTQIIGSLMGENDLQPMLVTESALLLAAAVVISLSWWELLCRNHIFPMLITIGLILFSPVMGVWTGLGELLLLLLFQAGFWTANTHNKQQLVNQSGIMIVLLLAAALSMALPLTAFHTEQLYDSVYAAEGFLYRFRRHMSGTADKAAADGQISRGNNYRIGTEQLVIRTNRVPTETLYLRGFTGGNYTGGNWASANDEDLFPLIAEDLGWEKWVDWIDGMYHSLYFVVNAHTADNSISEPILLDVEHASGEYEQYYVPYYSQWSGGYSMQNGGYSFLRYEQQDMCINWENLAENERAVSLEWFRELQESYKKVSKTAYTQIPKERLPRLTALCSEHPLNSLEEITAFILYTLQSRADYTLTPGQAPVNQDIVEYFLFERERGYCVHFAAAATLMYRLYGIPARYCAGYMVTPDDFQLLDDDVYSASVTDVSAHAWTEIFLDDYGWTPIEVTPSSNGVATASYPGFSGPELIQIIEERNWNLTASDIGEPMEEDSQQQALAPVQALADLDFEEHQDKVLAVKTCAVYTVFLLPFLADYRRLRRLKRLEDAGCRKIFFRLLQMLHYSGYLKDCDGSEADFARRLAVAVPVLMEDEAVRLAVIVSAAAYGPHTPTHAENMFAADIYYRAAHTVYRGLNWHRRLLFRYWKAFI